MYKRTGYINVSYGLIMGVTKICQWYGENVKIKPKPTTSTFPKSENDLIDCGRHAEESTTFYVNIFSIHPV